MTANLPPSSGLPSASAPEGARPQTIGMLLRRTREARRISAAAAAAALRLRPAYLEAIENGDRAALPAPVYAVGFVRAYAEFLGLDGNEAARRFKREGQGQDQAPDLSMPLPIAESSIPGGRILVAALVLAICGYGFWYYFGNGNRQQPDMVAAVPPSLTADTTTPNEAKAAVREPSAPRPAVPAEPVPATGAAAAAPVAPPAAAKPAPAPAPPAPTPAENPPPPAGHIYGASEGPVRIVLRFTGDCWIQIKGAGPDADLGKLMHAGDEFRVPDRPGLMARVGDSDALTILVDGRTVFLPKGPSLVRNIALNPAELLARAEPPAAAAAIPAAATPPVPPAKPAAAPEIKVSPVAGPADRSDPAPDILPSERD